MMFLQMKSGLSSLLTGPVVHLLLPTKWLVALIQSCTIGSVYRFGEISTFWHNIYCLWGNFRSGFGLVFDKLLYLVWQIYATGQFFNDTKYKD